MKQRIDTAPKLDTTFFCSERTSPRHPSSQEQSRTHPGQPTVARKLSSDGKQELIFAHQLLELVPELNQAESVIRVRNVSLRDFLRLFHSDTQKGILKLSGREGATHLVCLEVVDQSSKYFGDRHCLLVGNAPVTLSLELVLKTPHFHLGEVRPKFAYPVAYAGVQNAHEIQNQIRGQRKFSNSRC